MKYKVVQKATARAGERVGEKVPIGYANPIERQQHVEQLPSATPDPKVEKST